MKKCTSSLCTGDDHEYPKQSISRKVPSTLKYMVVNLPGMSCCVCQKNNFTISSQIL